MTDLSRIADQQMTKDEAIAFSKSGRWKDLTDDQLFRLQMSQEKLCVPFSEFHRAAEAALNRPIFTHEFAYPDRLWEEYHGLRDKATLDDILDLLPADKTIVVKT